MDAAERQAEAAFRVNAEGPLHLARLCRQHGVPLIHFSTNQVFNGKANSPYAIEDCTEPLNIYGRSKAAGEHAIAAELRHHLIFRLAWLFSEWPGNFLTDVVGRAEARDVIELVDDQQGTPTYARDVAGAINIVARRCLTGTVRWGTYHLSNLGESSLFAFANEILRFMPPERGGNAILRPVASDRRRMTARRPRYGVLDTGRTTRALRHHPAALAGCRGPLHAAGVVRPKRPENAIGRVTRKGANGDGRVDTHRFASAFRLPSLLLNPTAWGRG